MLIWTFELVNTHFIDMFRSFMKIISHTVIGVKKNLKYKFYSAAELLIAYVEQEEITITLVKINLRIWFSTGQLQILCVDKGKLFISRSINYEIITGPCVRLIATALFSYKPWSCWPKHNRRSRHPCGARLLFHETGSVKNAVKTF